MKLNLPVDRFRGCKAILFDLDGTLIDSYGPIADSLNYALKTMCFEELPRPRIRRMVGRGLHVLMEEASDREHVEEGMRLFRSRYREIYLDRSSLLPGVGEVMRALALRGYAMAVVTNKPAYFASALVERFGLARLLPVVYGPDRVAKGKPDPEMVRLALGDLGADAGAASLVGDMEIDVETARAAGVLSIGIPSGSRMREELEAASPDALLDRFDELLELFNHGGPG